MAMNFRKGGRKKCQTAKRLPSATRKEEFYLALEDDESRLQRRMFRMFGVEGTNALHFATSAKMIGSGLDEQLEKFAREHSDTKLIIVDTLQKVREMVSDNYSYSSDYEVIGKLKQFADRHGVCILIVHHTRKQPAGDSFEKISGTTGLSGCADGALIMQKEKRTDGKATLEISGRDQPDPFKALAERAATE
jgi:RecA-family ATPase